MRRPLAVLALAAVLGGCGGDATEPAQSTSGTSGTSGPSPTTAAKETPMADTITLRQNLPTQVDGVRVIAYNITDDGAGLQTPDGKVSVDVGDEVDLGGTSYTVAETVPHSDDRDEPRPNGWVSLSQD